MSFESIGTSVLYLYNRAIHMVVYVFSWQFCFVTHVSIYVCPKHLGSNDETDYQYSKQNRITIQITKENFQTPQHE